MTIYTEIILHKPMRYASHPLADLMIPNFSPTDLGVILRAEQSLLGFPTQATQLYTIIMQFAFMIMYGCTHIT